jgi:hypothetical protein
MDGIASITYAAHGGGTSPRSLGNAATAAHESLTCPGREAESTAILTKSSTRAPSSRANSSAPIIGMSILINGLSTRRDAWDSKKSAAV